MSGRQTVYVGDELVLKKPHACGANHWQVLRTGADIKIACAACGRVTWVPRARLELRIRRFLARGPRAQKALASTDEPTTEGS